MVSYLWWSKVSRRRWSLRCEGGFVPCPWRLWSVIQLQRSHTSALLASYLIPTSSHYTGHQTMTLVWPYQGIINRPWPLACVITGLCPWLDHWSMIWPIVMRCDPIRKLCTCYQITIHVIMWISLCYQVNQYTQDQSTGSKTSGSMHDWPHREIISMYFNE